MVIVVVYGYSLWVRRIAGLLVLTSKSNIIGDRFYMEIISIYRKLE